MSLTPETPGPATSPPQEALFLQGEGDAWFRRNVASLGEEGRVAGDPLISRALALAGAETVVVDVGSSNGWRAAAIQTARGGRAIAVDPSMEAIDDGTVRYPRVDFLRGVAHDLPLASESQTS